MPRSFLIILLLTPLVAQAAVQTAVDRFTGEFVVKSVTVPTMGTPELFVVAKRDEAEKFAGASFGMAFVNADWQYTRCHSMHVLADGARVPLPEASHRGDVIRGNVLAEYVTTALPDLEALRMMASAKVIEVKVCNDEFTLTDGQLLDIKNTVRTYDGDAKEVPYWSGICMLFKGLPQGVPLEKVGSQKLGGWSTDVADAASKYAKLMGANVALLEQSTNPAQVSSTLYRVAEQDYFDCNAAGGLRK